MTNRVADGGMEALSRTEMEARLKRALATAWRRARPDLPINDKGYVSDFKDNLLPGVHPAAFEEDLRSGSGDELGGKFLACHSSSALAVNTFAPWKSDLPDLTLGGVSGFTHLSFEAQCHTGLGGTPPNLDLVAKGPADVVGIESKCRELFDTHKVEFSKSYDRITDFRADTSWYAQIERLRKHKPQPGERAYLDAAQLVKHYLGLSHCYPDKQITLLYLFWEPLNWREFEAYRQHREEVSAFAASVEGEAVRFVAQSYPELWESWTGRTVPPWLSGHLASLNARYRIRI